MFLRILIVIVFLLTPSLAEASLVARPLRGSTVLFDNPKNKDGRRIDSLTHTGKVRSLLVIRQKDNWLGFRTPWRPNSSIYWARENNFALQKVQYKIVIDTGRRTLALWRRGKRMWISRVVVGTPSAPTPTGLFALNDFYKTGGDMRPFVFETTAQSEVFSSWLGGPARMAIHGRHGALMAPWGAASSNGCIRTPNWALKKIRKRATVGMPILVQR